MPLTDLLRAAAPVLAGSVPGRRLTEAGVPNQTPAAAGPLAALTRLVGAVIV